MNMLKCISFCLIYFIYIIPFVSLEIFCTECTECTNGKKRCIELICPNKCCTNPLKCCTGDTNITTTTITTSPSNKFPTEAIIAIAVVSPILLAIIIAVIVFILLYFFNPKIKQMINEKLGSGKKYASTDTFNETYSKATNKNVYQTSNVGYDNPTNEPVEYDQPMTRFEYDEPSNNKNIYQNDNLDRRYAPLKKKS